MSDQSKYVNTFIENSVGMIHEYVSLVLQLKTQAKLAEDMLADRNAIVSSLEQQVNEFRTELENSRSELSRTITHSNEQVNQSRADSSKWENEYNAMKARVEHLDTFANQVNEMKQMLIDKNKEIEDLQKKIDNLSKKQTKPSAPKLPLEKKDTFLVMKEPKDENDDF